MKLIIYLTVFALAAVHAIPDQTWTAIISKMEEMMEKNNNEVEKRFIEIEKNSQHQIEAMATRIEMIEQKNEQLQRKNVELTNQIQELGDDVSSSPLIAFSAIMTSGRFVPPGGEDIIPFDEAIANPGGHYDVTTYKFTCPSDSTYFFTFSLYSNDLQAGTDYDTCAARLVMDGTTIIEAFTYTTDANSADYKQVSTSAVVVCTLGSEVYVTSPWSEVGIYGFSSRTVFSGFIL